MKKVLPEDFKNMASEIDLAKTIKQKVNIFKSKLLQENDYQIISKQLNKLKIIDEKLSLSYPEYLYEIYKDTCHKFKVKM